MRDRGNDFGLRPEPRLSRHHQGQTQTGCGLDAFMPQGADVKVFVDTAPVLEKPLAAASGIGWQGKHTNLVSREFGSWLFLGAIFTTAELASDQAEGDHCGSCRNCLDICPTQAFPGALPVSMPGAAFPTSPSSTRAPSPDRIPRSPWATASMAVTTAWRSVPGTSLPQQAREAQVSRPRRSCCLPALARHSVGSQRPRAFRLRCSRVPRSSVSGATASSETS